MEKASSPPPYRRIIVFFFTALLVIVADQVTKALVRSSLSIGESIPETGWVRITHATNTGASFGLFQGQSTFFVIVSMIGVAAILAYSLFFYRRFPLLDRMWGRVGLGLVMGGAAGNLVDRLRFGRVTDFIDFSFWPAFNVADSATVVGVIILAATLLFTAPAATTRDG
jgi:signal peptidase II